MKKYLLTGALVLWLIQVKAQTLGNISFQSCPPCAYVGLNSQLVVNPVPGATLYHFFTTQPNSGCMLLDGQSPGYSSPDNIVDFTVTCTQAVYEICVYATNACCTTDTACCFIPGAPPQPDMNPANSTTALPNSSGIYSVLPTTFPCISGCFWSLIPTSAGTIAGSGNDTVTVSFSSTFTSCMLCAHYATSFNLHGPDTCMTINIPVGMEEFATNNGEFIIYPNPAAEELMVTGYLLSGKKEITIYDMIGKEVYRIQLQTLNFKLQTSFLQSGIYFIEINNVRKKFVKQ